MCQFSHLHCHSQFSLLDGAASIPGMMAKAKADGMPGIALTDHGNMFGAFQFVAEAAKVGIKPIVGCEFYLVDDRFKREFTKGDKDKRYHQLLLAKDQAGYQNLSKLCSLGFLEGLYGKYPRIDKKLLSQYKEGLIATTCCIASEVQQTILNEGEERGEEVFKEWFEIFGEDYYIEIQRHDLGEIDNTGMTQEDVNQILIKWSKKYGVPLIATNDSHYIEEEDWLAHDILLCVNTGDKISTPRGYGKGFRFGFPNHEFYFKTTAEMKELFKDIPEAIDNTNRIVDSITPPELKRDILLPNYTLPEGFLTQDDYLKHLTYIGAKKRYGTISAEVQERLDFELKIIKEMGFPGYFLIVQDFTTIARDLGVSVGPGRGSAAGSAVAYCVGITNIDPIKYKLLFERFLNPERVSMPDIDIDFDDDGRSKIIDYVVKKYGRNQVAQIITYGSMAAKSSIKDVGRVLDIPLPDVEKLTKMVPDISLAKVFNSDEAMLKKMLNAEQQEQANQMRTIIAGNDIFAETLQHAKKLEGSVRNTGIHACGVIISPDDITNYIPVCTSKDAELLVTQFDNKVVEDAGLLKMDFLGLKTLTIIRDAIALIKENYGIEIDPDEIPLDDEKTYELYQRGETNGTFQFESGGMQKHLKDLKPTNIEDLIAMNALYRPGPMQFIELFIQRKRGDVEVEYPHELLTDILKDTNGIMVYQEQIMQAAQIMAGYSLGEADLLRRAMGKKKMDVMQQQKEKFVEGAYRIHQVDKKKSSDVFDIMMKFAEYGFNRSHSAAYSVVAFQTGYLKANYPAEYMAAVMTNNMNDIKKITFFMEECRRMGTPVLGPDVNESTFKFTVNKNHEIRFGLGAVKGVGEGAVEAIVNERKENGPFTSIFDVTKRVDLRAANKRTFENMALAGAFDSFEGIHRAVYFSDTGDGMTFLEKALKFGASHQEGMNSSQVSLFGEASEVDMPEPEIPKATEWGTMEKLSKEKDVVGIYLSGHPLDDFKFEISQFCNATVKELHNFEALKGRKEIKIAGIVTEVAHRMTKTGKPFGILTIEDYQDAFKFFMFGDEYVKFKGYLNMGWFLYLVGSIEPGKWDKTKLEFKFTRVELLAEIKDKMTKSITLDVNIDEVSDDFINQIESIVNSSNGNCKFSLNLIDRKEKNAVVLTSRSKKIALTDEVLNTFDKMQGVEYSVG
ncbi:DNA polymerase III subunit alpha [Acidiluteibacter ferrifornacis]|uniref:DNA polymerase III subunit alpha n=1 Tax=Acidiluteibacter ferrifornacis TaxID=2692424 RepID=A0A6N9NJM3_9FLAO|nr:DNA polymerase III subunit alpha [Acidiluteibacter ferrifornacis]NBG65387.1 DNA polymerase III subunit alpha [Acidiluteibacter ferrifornacis]